MNRQDKLTNLAMFVVCLALLGSFGRTFYLRHPGAGPDSGVSRGQRIDLPADLPASAGPTLLMVLSTHCHFCNESAPFYQKLTAFHRSAPGNLRVVATLPEPTGEATSYLKQHGVGVDYVLTQSTESVGVNGTPTLLLLDPQNKVEESWEGRLDPTQEARVFASLQKICADCTVPAVAATSSAGFLSDLLSASGRQAGAH